MISKDMVVKIKDGLNVGTVALFIQEASQFDSSIYLEYDNKKVNAKSIMGMMTLNVESGEEISVSADGEDEDAALNSIEKYGLLCDNYLLKDIFNKKYNLLLLNFTNSLVNHYGNRRLVIRHAKELLDTCDLLRKELKVKTIVCFDGLDKEICKLINGIEGLYPKLIINYVDEYYPYTTSLLIKKKYLKEYKNKILYLDTLTTYKIYNVLKRGIQSDHKYISITGTGINNEKILVKVKYGTTISELLKKIVGKNYKNFDYYINNPFTKEKIDNINYYTVDDDIDVIYVENKVKQVSHNCIKCGKCLEVCPIHINPRSKDKSKCIKCGSCNRVCPSNINLLEVTNHE